MVRSKIQPGAVIDGFTVGDRVHIGGMATLWSASHPGIEVPLLMKVPRVSEGEDPAAIVSFEMEQMILPGCRDPMSRPVSLPAISPARPMSQSSASRARRCTSGCRICRFLTKRQA
jgi:hypothetical protein